MTAADVVFSFNYEANSPEGNGLLSAEATDDSTVVLTYSSAQFTTEGPGGQRQRVAIARALAPCARFIVADKPVSMLDVSIRLGVLNLLAELQREENLGVLYITHDLATARHFSDEIMVLVG